MSIQGLRDTSNFVANERPENWRQGLMLLYPNSAKAGNAPLTALTSLMKSESTDDPHFHWFEKGFDDRRLELHATSGDLANSSAGSVDTVTLAAGSNGLTFVANDLFRVEQTGEIVRLAVDPTSDTEIRIVRGYAGSTPAAVDANGTGINPNLVHIGSAFEEGSLAPTGTAFDPTEQYNYTQIFRETFEITRTASKTKLRTKSAIDEMKRENLEQIADQMEMAFWLGKRSLSSQNQKPIRTTNGVINMIDSNNVVSYTSGQVKLQDVEVNLEAAFKYGSSEKVAFAGNRAILALNQCIRKNTSAQWQVREGIKEYGMQVSRITCPFGELVIKSHPRFNQITGGTTNGTAYYGMNSWMFILDMDDIKYRYLTDSDLDYYDNLQIPGADGLKAGHLAECGLQLAHASKHSLWKQMNSGVVDS